MDRLSDDPEADEEMKKDLMEEQDELVALIGDHLE